MAMALLLSAVLKVCREPPLAWWNLDVEIAIPIRQDTLLVVNIFC